MAERKPRLTARTADKHILYERSVQSPDSDVDFIDRIYRKTYGEHARLLREDFCGTAALCCEWVRRRKQNESIGVDLDGPTLDWSRRRRTSNRAKRPEKSRRWSPSRRTTALWAVRGRSAT